MKTLMLHDIVRAESMLVHHEAEGEYRPEFWVSYLTLKDKNGGLFTIQLFAKSKEHLEIHQGEPNVVA